MSLAQTQLTTNTSTALKLVQAQTRRRGLLIKNHDGTNGVVLGGSNVAITGVGVGGILLKAGESLYLFEGPMPQEEWWAIGAVGTPIVGVVESFL